MVMEWGMMVPVHENAKKSRNKGHIFKYARGGENSHDFC